MIIKRNTQLLLDFSLGGLFALISMIIMGLILPEGLTTKFLFRGSKLIGFSLVVLTLIFLICWYSDKDFKFKKKFDVPVWKDLILLTLPMSPVCDYALTNIVYLNVSGLFYIIVITLLFSIFFSFIFPIIFSYFGSFKVLMIIGLTLSFTILNLAKIANDPNNHFFNSQFVTQGSYWIISFIIIYLLYIFYRRAAYIFCVVFMFSGVIINFYNYYLENKNKSKN